MENIDKLFQLTDWKLLAEQKETLYELADKAKDDKQRLHIDGIIALLDKYQDAAEEQGYPVAWLNFNEGGA